VEAERARRLAACRNLMFLERKGDVIADALESLDNVVCNYIMRVCPDSACGKYESAKGEQ
jgi:hypothetical protein